MKALVVTTVHRADDPRIRERTVGSLAAAFEVRYATGPPMPSTRDDHDWLELRGGRIRRWWGALRQMLRGGVDVVSLHDPELIPAGLVARLLRRVPVVVDVHEDVPAQIRHKGWIPRVLRGPAAWAAHRFLRLAERFCVVTLAEPNYAHLFRSEHPVFPNYPAVGALPDPAPDAGYLVYVGDVTEARGALDMVEAVAGMARPRPLRIVGRCADDLRERMEQAAAAREVDLTLLGPLPHREAMEQVAGAAAGLSLLRDLPNYIHSLPTKVIEYLAMGVPVVASDLPGTRTAVEGLAGVHLAAPGETAAAAAALDSALADRPVAAAQAAEVRERMVWPADLVRQVYRTAAGAPA